jgi:hypothetical protein
MDSHRAERAGLSGVVLLLLLTGVGPLGAYPPPSQVRADAAQEGNEERIEQAAHDHLVHEAEVAEAKHGTRKGFFARLFRARR